MFEQGEMAANTSFGGCICREALGKKKKRWILQLEKLPIILCALQGCSPCRNKSHEE